MNGPGNHRPASPSVSGWFPGLALPRLLGRRTWVGAYEGHEVRVVARGLLPAQLYVDGRPADRRSPLVPRNRRIPLLSASLPTAGREARVVEVYFGLLGGPPAVSVAGRRIHVEERV